MKRNLREDVKARAWVPAMAIFLNLLVLGGFVWVKLNSDPFVIGVAVVAMIVIAIAEQIFLGLTSWQTWQDRNPAHSSAGSGVQ
jgi:hypothetical protein